MSIQIKNRWTGEVLKTVSSLVGADLVGANLRCANLSGADLSGADLVDANLRSADLVGADLVGANLRGADLVCANLSGADLSGASLRSADLVGANLSGADLVGANLVGANLVGADLVGANLSQVKGLNPSTVYLEQFKTDKKGVIAYRAEDGRFAKPKGWKFEPGAFLTETPNPNRTDECGCGVSFATREWVEREHPYQTIWECRINWLDLADVVVPYNTDGKARCARLELLRVVKEAE